jgi:hypothetical protein
MMRTILACVVSAILVTSPASALTDDQLAIARTFEAAWGVVYGSAREVEESPGMGCGEPRAITIRVEQDEWQVWRLYSRAEDPLGVVIIGASDDGHVQRLTVEEFAPIGMHTDVYELHGDRLSLGLGWGDRQFKRC